MERIKVLPSGRVLATGLSLENERPRLKALSDASADCRLIAIRHVDHDEFFEQVSQAVWAAVPDISPA
jgi:hypothetical protein